MSEPRRPDRVQQFFGAAIMAGGALIFAACGLCTLSFVGSSLQSVLHRPAGASSAVVGLVFFAVIGGAPTLGGFMLMLLGWRMFYGRPSKPAGRSLDE